ncbi:MAG: hypothetical protein ACPG4T_06825, partial [Nannocystaceae bacterium]
MAFDKLKSKLEQTRASVVEAASETFGDARESLEETANALREFGQDKLEVALGNLLEQLESTRPLLDDAGYDIQDVNVQTGVPPRISLVVLPKVQGQTQLAAVLERESLTKPQRALFECLKQVYRMEDVFAKHGYTVRGIEVDIGLGMPP